MQIPSNLVEKLDVSAVVTAMLVTPNSGYYSLLVKYLLIMRVKDNVPLNQIHNVIIISTLQRQIMGKSSVRQNYSNNI
jgi:hypothetical protein